MMSWIIAGCTAAAICIVIILRAAVIRKPQVSDNGTAYDNEITPAVINLSDSIKIQNISLEDQSRINWEAFDQFHRFLEERYPLIHKNMNKEVFDKSLMFSLKGKNPDLLPLCLLAHQDVVGAQDDLWDVPPFDGVIKDGYVWGRGTLDDKGTLIAIMESVESLLREEKSPDRGLYLCFGHNEEIGSGGTLYNSGAREMAEELERRHVKLHMVLDEGGSYIDARAIGFNSSLAGIALCEKGYLDLKISAKSKGGHSSTPPRHSAVGKVAVAAQKIENSRRKIKWTLPMKMLIKEAAPYASFPFRLILTNMWLFSPVLKLAARFVPTVGAFFSTTRAVTMSSGSNAANVLPQQASITVNFRVAPYETNEQVIERIKRIVGKGFEVEVEKSSPPSPVSMYNNEAYNSLKDAILHQMPSAVVAPFLMQATTDAKAYYRVCDSVYRFLPFPGVSEKQWRTVHSNNECVPIASYKSAIVFYRDIIMK